MHGILPNFALNAMPQGRARRAADQKLKGAGQTAPTAVQSIKRERAKYRASREPTITQGTLVTLQDVMLQKAIQKQDAFCFGPFLASCF